MLDLWFIRHGETDYNHSKRWQGHIDIPLNDHGRSQAERLAPRLARTAFDAVYTSDLERARTTARLALPGTHLHPDPRLREICFGYFEGKTWADLDEGARAELSAWWKDPYRNRIRDGESFTDLEARLRAFVDELPRSGRVAVFTHGGVIRCMLWSVTGPPDGRSWTVALDNTSITRMQLGEDWRTLACVNDCAHLEPT
jgi:alpha-ribazole phosphatase